MQKPRFQEGDHVRIVRIYSVGMELTGDLDFGLYNEYYETLVGLCGKVISIEEKYKHDDSIFFVYEVEGQGLNLFFHEGELGLYDRR